MECPTTVLNPNQRKEQKYSTRRGDHWPISVHFPLPFLYGYASFRRPYSNNSLIDQLEERNPSWIALPCLKRFMTPVELLFWGSNEHCLFPFSINEEGGVRSSLASEARLSFIIHPTLFWLTIAFYSNYSLVFLVTVARPDERENYFPFPDRPRAENNSLFFCWFLLSYLE